VLIAKLIPRAASESAVASCSTVLAQSDRTVYVGPGDQRPILVNTPILEQQITMIIIYLMVHSACTHDRSAIQSYELSIEKNIPGELVVSSSAKDQIPKTSWVNHHR